MLRAALGGTVIFFLAVVMVDSQQRFPLALSVAQFRYDSTRTRVELAYSIADTHLVFRTTENAGIVRAAVELCISVLGLSRSDSTCVVLETQKTVGDATPSLLVGKRTFVLMPDQYTIRVRIRDALRQNSAVLERSFPLVVRSFAHKRLSASSIELAQWIVHRDTNDARQVNSAFIKNDLYVVPLPNSVYEGTAPMLFAYTELYNLDRCHCDSIELHYHVLDAAVNEVFDLRYRRPVIGDAQAEVVSISLDGMPSGVYYLALGLSQERGEELQLSRQQFYLVNPELPPQQPVALSEDELFLQSPFATMNRAQLDTEVASARFIASASELDAYNQLTDLAAKRKFVFRFWLQRDPDPTTPINERYEEFRKAREYAAKHYSTPRFPQGWNSDRGRVLLKYGFPSQIDRAYFNMDGAHPHEIWRYDNVQGGVIFVFVDQQGTENFVLVHSTALNEIRNENWYRQFALPNYLDPNSPVR
ncbi:MAG: GWxTD domain-containing protein [Chlorobi bacterium]|nr:GWxTD domain-containing protein [Chlorobiota bacterium]